MAMSICSSVRLFVAYMSASGPTDQGLSALAIWASLMCYNMILIFCIVVNEKLVNPLMGTGNYSAMLNNMKLVHWLLMGGLLHLVEQGGEWVGPQPARSPPRCTKCNSPPISDHCTNHHVKWAVAVRF